MLKRGGFGGFRGFRGSRGSRSWGSRGRWGGASRRTSHGSNYYGLGGSYGIIFIGGYQGHPLPGASYYGHSYTNSSRPCDPTDLECTCAYQYQQSWASLIQLIATVCCCGCVVALCAAFCCVKKRNSGDLGDLGSFSE